MLIWNTIDNCNQLYNKLKEVFALILSDKTNHKIKKKERRQPACINVEAKWGSCSGGSDTLYSGTAVFKSFLVGMFASILVK